MTFFNPKLILGFIAMFFLFVFLSRYLIIGQAIYGDGIYYYAYTRSIVKDGDLNFENEYEHRYGPDTNNSKQELEKSEFAPDTQTGHLANKYPIGPGLIWIPVFSIADAAANVLSNYYKDFPNTGYSDIYQISVGVFNVLTVFLGLIILYRLLLVYFSSKTSLLTIIAVALGSNLFYYSAIDAINSHPLSFVFASVYFLTFFKKGVKDKHIILGLTSGILALIRTQDIIFILFTVLTIATEKTGFKEKIKKSILSILVFSFVFIIQLLSWKLIYGSYFALPYISSNEGFNFLEPHIVELFFSSKIGLFIWTPIYIISAIGFILTNKKFPNVVYFFIIAQVYLISSWSGWTQGESFGVRMLISVLPLISIGIAAFIDRIRPLTALILVFFLIIFNLSAILYFLLVAQNPTIDRGGNTQDRAMDKIEHLLR